MSRYRKAIAAFITPLLGLPIIDWISGNTPFDWTLLQGAIGGAITAVIVYFAPNTPLPGGSTGLQLEPVDDTEPPSVHG